MSSHEHREAGQPWIGSKLERELLVFDVVDFHFIANLLQSKVVLRIPSDFQFEDSDDVRIPQREEKGKYKENNNNKPGRL